MAKSGEEQVDEFEKLVSKFPKGIRLSSGLWPRYLRGDVIPLGSLEKHKASLVERLDGKFPGTAKVFHHAIWELFDFDHVLGPGQLQEIYLDMGNAVWNRFVHPAHVEPDTPDGTARSFWKVHRTTADLQRSWSHIPGLDGLAVCLIEARMAYFAQDQENFTVAVLSAVSHLRKYAKAQELQFSKQLSALLILEHMCLSLAENMIETKTDYAGKKDPHSLIIKNRRDDWAKRYQDHLDSLSKPARALLLKWVKETTNAKFTW